LSYNVSWGYFSEAVTPSFVVVRYWVLWHGGGDGGSLNKQKKMLVEKKFLRRNHTMGSILSRRCQCMVAIRYYSQVS
jgi:hypothetical protein